MPGLSLPSSLPTNQRGCTGGHLPPREELIRGPSSLKVKTGWSPVSQAYSSLPSTLLPCWAALNPAVTSFARTVPGSVGSGL